MTSAAERLRSGLDRALELTVVGSFSRVGFAARRALFHWDTARPADLTGRTVVLTGATSGLGYAAAHLFARSGADLWLLGRDPARTDAVRQSVAGAAPRARVETVVADLAALDDVRGAAATIAAAVPHVDALVHNAGTLVHRREVTPDGIEVTAQVHVVAPFLLTALLLPRLRASTAGRVVTVSSGGMYTQRLDVDALVSPPAPFSGTRAYANAKRAQVVLTEQWARHPAGEGVVFHAMHPGWADTPGLQAALPGFRRVMRPLLRSAEQGADTMVWLAGSNDALASNGAFWLDRARRPTHRLPRTRTPEAEAARLWHWCAEVSGARALLEATR